MRLAFTTAASSLCLLLCTMQPAASQSATASADVPAASSSSDAAEKHAKRTACLKEAKTRKLVGAQRNAFVKDCIVPDGQKPLASTRSAAPD
jgi:hypothetical protein